MNHLQSKLAVGLGTVIIKTVKPNLVGSICIATVGNILDAFPLLPNRKVVEPKSDNLLILNK